MIAALMLLLAAPLFAAAPAWTTAPSTLDQGTLFVVGSASSMEGALAAALANAAGLISREKLAGNGPGITFPSLSVMEKESEDTLDRSHTLKSFAKEKFGPILITVLSKDYQEEGAGKGSQLISESCKVLFLKDGRKYEIKTFLESVTSADMKMSKEGADTFSESDGLGLRDLMGELASQGFTLKQWYDASDYTQFVALSHNGGKTKK